MPLSKSLKDYGTVLGVVLVVAVLWNVLQPGRLRLPDQAPAFTFTATSGTSTSLDAMRGRIVVVNFWATWCAPCRAEIPEFSAFAAKHPEIAVLGVSMEDISPTELETTALRLGARYPVGVADAALRQDYDVKIFPTTVVIGPDGRVWQTVVGGIDSAELERLVQAPKE